jgi:CRP-like cAMP-binding protein
LIEPGIIASVGRRSISSFASIIARGDWTAFNSAVVTVPGVASRFDVDRHGLAVYMQIQQTARCNASHTMESALARCLLRTHALVGGAKLVLTQEAMAQMIGARRNSVSLVASTLQQANFIHYSRGHIEILDIDGFSKTWFECYATVEAQYNRLLRPRCLS